MPGHRDACLPAAVCASCIALSDEITELFKIGRERKAAPAPAPALFGVEVALGENANAARFARSPAASLALAYPSRG